MRRICTLAALALTLLSFVHPALAQTPTGAAGASSTSVTWTMLDPGNDWAADLIRNLFPMFANADGSAAPQSENSVIGTMLGELTAFVGAVALMFVSYSVIMHIHRGAETSKLLGTNQTTVSVVRLGFAAILMMPIPGGAGFSVGQQLVVRSALAGVGMAKVVYNNAVKALGPDGQVIAQPMVPGTKTIVAGLIRSELCKDLVNLETGSTNSDPLVPSPNPVTAQANPDQGVVAWNYAMSDGNGNGTPVCGSVSIRTPSPNAKNLIGVSVDMAQTQRDVLTKVLQQDIQGPVQTIASNFFQYKTANSLAPLNSLFTTAASDYRSQLTQAASDIRQKLQAQISQVDRSQSMDAYLNNTNANQAQLSGLGWSAAGAYYLEFARLNAQTLSLMSGTPVIDAPTYQGLGSELSKDIAPLVQSSEAYLTNLEAYANATDGNETPNGNAELMLGAIPGSTGSSVLEQALRALHLSDYLLQFATYLMNPPSAWEDPFGSLMQLGNEMILAALIAMGAFAILSSTTGTVGTMLFGLLTAQPEVVAGAGVGHVVIAKLGAFIITGCMALLVPGLTIAYVLPMIPYAMWIAGVIGWLIMVCEAVIAVPLWMLAHMTTNGEGLHGKAQQGYALLFNVVFRPVLMLFGLFLGYFIFDASCWLIRQTFGIAAGMVLGNGWPVINMLGVVVLLAIFVLLHVVCALLSFRMIALVPHHVPRMIGFDDGGRIDLDQFGKDAAMIGTAATLSQINNLALDNIASKSAKARSEGKYLSGPRNRLADNSDGTINASGNDGGE